MLDRWQVDVRISPVPGHLYLLLLVQPVQFSGGGLQEVVESVQTRALRRFFRCIEENNPSDVGATQPPDVDNGMAYQREP
ncbi:unnamed protein product [Leptidea sinapis]|uniref:Uncharacterized protein n=1 Tax=Leptidea sinapis TaxID=189913 RepID=A0A5E4QQT1_9NEOP|nr:unnamed protein product [Leptidea sinapis]